MLGGGKEVSQGHGVCGKKRQDWKPLFILLPPQTQKPPQRTPFNQMKGLITGFCPARGPPQKSVFLLAYYWSRSYALQFSRRRLWPLPSAAYNHQARAVATLSWGCGLRPRELPLPRGNAYSRTLWLPIRECELRAPKGRRRAVDVSEQGICAAAADATRECDLLAASASARQPCERACAAL